MIWRNVTGKKSVGRAHIFTLDCGHAVRRQYSYGCPKISRCKACESLRDGEIHTEHHPDGSKTVTLWDSSCGRPIATCDR